MKHQAFGYSHLQNQNSYTESGKSQSIQSPVRQPTTTTFVNLIDKIAFLVNRVGGKEAVSIKTTYNIGEKKYR